MKKPLPRIVVTSEMGVTIFNGHLKTIRTIAKGHQSVTKRLMTLRVFSYLNTSIVHVPLASFFVFLCCQYCQVFIFLLLCPLSYSFPFVSV
jgi:hypothetical protein